MTFNALFKLVSALSCRETQIMFTVNSVGQDYGLIYQRYVNMMSCESMVTAMCCGQTLITQGCSIVGCFWLRQKFNKIQLAEKKKLAWQ